MQLETPGHLVGKVIALAMSLANCAQPVGQLVYGGLFDSLRGNLVPVALGTAVAAFAIGLVTFRVLKNGLRDLCAEEAQGVEDGSGFDADRAKIAPSNS